jgi:hypothetical protein|tara:strand:+ start:5800 stop:8388 length:2589 start_codon:yes stop_codon:yes gene_type:complete
MNIQYKKRIILFLFYLSISNINAQNPSALFQNWVDAQVNNSTPTLPTFSYAGYHNGEIGLPVSFSQQVYNVTDYGAVANDNISDKEAIKATIAAAEANNNGGIIFFPPGRFIVHDTDPTVAGVTPDISDEVIRISKSNIVIKGSGSGSGGTELYQKSHTTHPEMATKDYLCPYLFLFWNGEDSQNSFITDITGNSDRESYIVQVANTSNISVGQRIELYVKNNDAAFVDEELAPFSKSDFFQPNNLKIANNGVEVREIHEVVSKTANSITFKEPIHRAINATYGWKINNFKALEEVGIQDLKYTGGFIWKHLHHQAPQELFPSEPNSGPNAFLSSSGWSGVRFNHVVNGWITNVEFSAMSQAAIILFSANVTALNNVYTGNPGHNFITTNSSTGCFLGKNNDLTTGVWHGSGVNGKSIGNVLWRNTHPQNGSSGIEMHASQPRSTLVDACTGGIFFNQGGALQSLPNHLKNMVLWNFEGVSYRNDFVKSFRPNNETAYAKFITPIISGLKGFTMSNQANQYQVNESPGTHVDEESLYEAQLKYRLGTLPNWITNETTNPFYPIFQYEDFGTENRGYSVYVVTNPDNQDEAQIWKRVNDIPDAADSNNLFTETRPENRIPANGERDQKALAIVGTASSKNYKMEAWAVMQTVDLSVANQFLNADDAFKFVSFWTEQRFANGNTSNLEVYVSTDYTNDVGAADWTNVTSNLNQIATSGQNPQMYIESVLDISAYTSNTFTLAFKYESDNSAHSQTNRNGTFYVSDVKYFVSETTLSNDFFELDSINNVHVYPNPFSSEIKIGNLEGKFDKVLLFDALGRSVLSKIIKGEETATIKTNFDNLSKGIYFLKLIGTGISKDFKLIKK